MQTLKHYLKHAAWIAAATVLLAASALCLANAIASYSLYGDASNPNRAQSVQGNVYSIATVVLLIAFGGTVRHLIRKRRQ
jgi:hypothetical protein